MHDSDIADAQSLVGRMQTRAHEDAKSHGFWGDPPYGNGRLSLQESVALKAALVASEAMELLEAARKDTLYDPCNKAAGLNNAEEECADVFIRLLDLAEFLGVDLVWAAEQKRRVNLSRPHRHGKLF